MIETKKFSKRIALALITCLIACMGMFALAGCESDEQQAENALKGYLDDFKNGLLRILPQQIWLNLSRWA